MIALGILLSVAGIGFFCWLLFTLAVYALPFVVGMTTALWAYDSGAGPIGAFLIGAFAAGLTFGLGQLIFTSVRSAWVRFAIALAFAAPAAVAGYHATLGLTRLTMPSEGWQMTFSVLGAIAIGVTAWTRVVAIPRPVRPGRLWRGADHLLRWGGPERDARNPDVIAGWRTRTALKSVIACLP